MAQGLREIVAFARVLNLNWVPSTYASFFTTTFKSTSRGSTSLLRYPQAGPLTHKQIYSGTHK